MEEIINTTKIEDPGKENTKSDKKIIILLDTSWLVAVLDENDSHHVAAASSLGALLPYRPSFHVSVLAALETISRLIRINKMSVKLSKKKLLDFIGNKLQAKGATYTFRFNDILDRYNTWSRKGIKKLTAIDFCIVTEGIGLGAKILTCDLRMYKLAKKYYDYIYFMSDKVEAQESDLARLIHDIQLFCK